MTRATARRTGNSLMLLGILVSNSIYQSEIGGPGTIYNSLGFLLGIAVLLVNRRYVPGLLAVFAVPVTWLLASMALNLDTLTAGGINTGLSAIVACALLTLKPLPLDKPLLRRAIVLYLLVSLVLTIRATYDNLGLGMLGGNSSFNINPNSAALYLFACLALTLVMVRGWLQLALAVGYFALGVTTASRAALLVGSVLFFAFVFASDEFRRAAGSRLALLRRRLVWLAGIGAVPSLAMVIIPGSVAYMLERLARAGLGTASVDTVGGGRDEKWRHAFEVSFESVHSLLLGHGPATAVLRIGTGTHSSYVEAFTSVGWPYMLSMVVAVCYVCLYHWRRQERDFVIFAAAICLYGATESVLFAGLVNIWYLFIMLSLYYRSADPLDGTARDTRPARSVARPQRPDGRATAWQELPT